MLCGVVSCLVFAIGVGWPNVWIVWSTRKHVHTKLAGLPTSRHVLVLGCAPKLMSGSDNAYFVARMAATAHLCASGNVARVLVSGGPLRQPLVVGGVPVYSEADFMKAALVELGVDATAIEVDRRGVRTRSSIERVALISAAETWTIVSQSFHTPRAVYLARRHGVNAHAFNAPAPSWSKSRLKVGMREVLSRMRAFWEG